MCKSTSLGCGFFDIHVILLVPALHLLTLNMLPDLKKARSHHQVKTKQNLGIRSQFICSWE